MSTTSPHPERPPERRRLALPDAAATHMLGVSLGRQLRAGDVLALVGELGAGKTTLTRGLGEGLGLDDPTAVTSPTYLLVVEHAGPRPLLHADAYLPAKLAGFLADGGLEYLFQQDAVAVVEWADRIPAMVPATALWLELAMAPGGGRTASFCCAKPEDYPFLARLGDNEDHD